MQTEFTRAQIDKLRQLVSKEHSAMGGAPGRVVDVELHHLQYKLDDYARNAAHAERLRESVRAATG